MQYPRPVCFSLSIHFSALPCPPPPTSLSLFSSRLSTPSPATLVHALMPTCPDGCKTPCLALLFCLYDSPSHASGLDRNSSHVTLVLPIPFLQAFFWLIADSITHELATSACGVIQPLLIFLTRIRCLLRASPKFMPHVLSSDARSEMWALPCWNSLAFSLCSLRTCTSCHASLCPFLSQRCCHMPAPLSACRAFLESRDCLPPSSLLCIPREAQVCRPMSICQIG